MCDAYCLQQQRLSLEFALNKQEGCPFTVQHMRHLPNWEAGLLQYVQYYKPTDKFWCRILAEYVPIEVSYPIKAEDWTSSAISMHMPVVES